MERMDRVDGSLDVAAGNGGAGLGHSASA
jgi:hypothetical protein